MSEFTENTKFDLTFCVHFVSKLLTFCQWKDQQTVQCTVCVCPSVMSREQSIYQSLLKILKFNIV